MAIYNLGKLIEPEDDITEPAEDTTFVAKSVENYPNNYKHGFFSRSRTDWTEIDKAVVQLIADGHRINAIAALIGMGEKTFHLGLIILRKVKRAKTNAELVAIAFRDGAIK